MWELSLGKRAISFSSSLSGSEFAASLLETCRSHNQLVVALEAGPLLSVLVSGVPLRFLFSQCFHLPCSFFFVECEQTRGSEARFEIQCH